MIAGECEVPVACTDDDTLKFLDQLYEMKLHNTALCQQTTDELARQCLAKFDDHQSTLECRAVALYALVAQMAARNPSMLVHVPDIGRRLKTASVLQLPVDDTAGAKGFHRQVVVIAGI